MASRLLLTTAICTFAGLSAFGADRATEQLELLPPSIEIDAGQISAYQPLTAIDGLWQMTDGGGEFAILPLEESDPSKGYMMVAIDCADRTVLPGTVMGILFNSAKQGIYDASIYSDSNDGRLISPKRFTLTLNGDNSLSFVPVKNRLKVNIRNLLPYMFRITVTRQSNRPENLDGAVRIGASAGKPLNPRIL